MRIRRTAFALSLAAVLGAAGAASAEQPKNPAPKGPGPKAIKFKEIKIEGTIQKPQAFYILQRSSLNFQGLELKSSFLPNIIKSVDQPPF